MNTPKRLLSGCDDTSEYPTGRRRLRLASNDDLSTPIDEQIEQVAKRHRVPSETVKRIFSDLLNEPTVVEYLRTRINQDETTTVNNRSSTSISPTRHDESTYFDASSQLNPSNAFSQSFLPPTMVNEYDPLWLEFLHSLNPNENNSTTTNIQPNTTQSTVTFDSLFSEEDEDDEEFIGPDDENPIESIDEKKLRVSRRELALLLKDNNATSDDHISHPDEELLPSDQYESLWTEFLASLQTGANDQQDEQPKSIITTTTEEDDNEDDPEFRLPDTDYDIDDDLGEDLHVSKRELALLLEDNASILNNEELINPESVSSNATTSTIAKTFEFHLTSDQRNILQYQLTAYVQLLTQYILLQRETNGLATDDQSAIQLFNDLVYFRDKQAHSILDVPILNEAQRLIESSPPISRRKSLGNHLPFHLMDIFCKSPAFVHDSLLPTCLFSSNNSIFNDQPSRNFVSGEDCLMALGLEQKDAKMLIVGHSEKNINDRLNSLRYARVRRGKQNPVKAYFTYGSVPDISLNPWYHLPNGYDIQQIYPNGLIEKVNVTFPSWFRLSYKRSRQLTKHTNTSLTPTVNTSIVDPNDSLSSSTIYVVVDDSTSNSRTSTSPNKVLQQIHMLHLLNSYPKLQPKQQQ